MRPRGSPRGIRVLHLPRRARTWRFNEAAGKSPRNPGVQRKTQGHNDCFNEAAGSPRGIDDDRFGLRVTPDWLQ